MKIAIAADGADLQSRVANRFGTSQYLVIVDLETGYFEAVPNPGFSGHRGAGVQAVVLAVRENVKSVLTGYCSPPVRGQLMANGIEVLTGLRGRVQEVVEKYKRGNLLKPGEDEVNRRSREIKIDRVTFAQAVKSSASQFSTLLPAVVGVILLIGLFNTFVSKELLISIFSGNLGLDTLWGACFGSVLAGNPINSYVIGGELLRHGVSLFAVTALIITWVTVGLVQLPAEIAALGRKFALLRNTICFILSIPIAIITVVILNLAMR